MKNPFALDTSHLPIPSQEEINEAIKMIRLDGFSAENISNHFHSYGSFIARIKLFEDYRTAAFLAAEFICLGYRAPEWIKCMDGSISLQWIEK